MGGFQKSKKMLSHLKTAITKWPHSWTTFKFGCLFAGSELTQQVIIKKIWSDVDKKLRKGKNERDPLDWANIGRYAIWGFSIFPHILRSWYKIRNSLEIPGRLLFQKQLLIN